MTELKCPVCKTGNIREYADGLHYACDNEDCPSYDETDEKTFDVLIDTKKKLDVAVDALDVISQITNQIDVCDTANDALNTITALEQKDVK